MVEVGRWVQLKGKCFQVLRTLRFLVFDSFHKRGYFCGRVDRQVEGFQKQVNQKSRNLGLGRRHIGGSQLRHRGLNYLDPQNMARINWRHKRPQNLRQKTSS
ncbi:hypothetical protein CHARACLAT_019705 [Characodon lateralis]|uniref:Uncharacterized protein n=1 Tax=Characodon lateralis TaxID=208331 RepID=A0ABU7CTP7_9TELE|nr:hypothetical protein [Characodon lateralis]